MKIVTGKHNLIGELLVHSPQIYSREVNDIANVNAHSKSEEANTWSPPG